MNPIYLKNFRKKMKLNQEDFAKCVGIERSLISKYETGKKKLSLERFREIKSKFGFLKDNDPQRLSVMIDYLRITFKSVMDLDTFCERFLFVKFKDFTASETRLMTYNRLWKRGDIWIFDYADKHENGNFQITIQLSGKGCRQMELIFENKGKTWHEMLRNMFYHYTDMNVSRLDIAVDELFRGYDHVDEQFLLSDMIAKYYKKELHFEDLKTWNYIGGGGLKFDSMDDIENNRQGISLYFGSRQSNLYFNFYEKRYELAKQERISVEEALEIFGIWNRYELRFSNEKSNGVVEEYINGVDIGEIARGIINKKIQVYDGTNRYGAFLADKKWQLLFGGVEPLKLTTAPEPYSIDRTIKWLMYQVSNKLAMVDEYDKIVNEQYLKMILESGEISEEDEKRLNDIRVSYKST
ncbi:XRE family transcriptional regulator [Streptococcus canis]|uniref:replication initiation factor domain-containing protein n=1 Tax=Streptococcus canis TaxID=1329 RepID=UPI0029495F48|nr:replication initiation factor domain-containing protein [Streptococcus canis]MDV5987557.1 XRE family transcriptional regulator [Streptococcus canis]